MVLGTFALIAGADPKAISHQCLIVYFDADKRVEMPNVIAMSQFDDGGTIKSELVWRTVFYTRAQAEQAIARYIDGFYNRSGASPRSTTSAPHSRTNRVTLSKCRSI